MNWIDIFSLICILVLTLIGVWRGFLKGLFRVLAWATAIAGAYFSYDLLGNTIASNLQIGSFTVRIVCICLGFLIPFLTLFVAGHFFEKKIKDTSLGKANRILGGILGLCKGWLICFVLLTILHILPVSGDLREARNDAIAYSLYKRNIELFGFSSKEVDLVGMAEERAKKLSNELTNKAVEKVKESSVQAAEQAKEAAVKAIEEKKDSLVKKIDAKKDSAVSKVKEKADE